MILKRINNVVLLFATVSVFAKCSNSKPPDDLPYKPNIVWIVVEDMSEHWSCYGESLIQTPNIDKLAKEGELFENAFVTSPVCSASRSALLTGMKQTTIGAHNHRSQREKGNGGGNKDYYGSYQLTDEIPFLPKLFKEADYYTVLGNELSIFDKSTGENLGKTDYNFEWDNKWYDSNDWKDRKPGQPFFAQIQLGGGKLRNIKVDNPVKLKDVALPPYYPDDEIMRTDWSEYLNSVLYLDGEVEKIIDRLEAEGIADSTVIFLFTDHGISHLRGKQFLYEDGIKIPMIVKWPAVTLAGSRRKDLVTQIDISATSLFLAGIPIPETMQGQPFYGKNYQPPQYVFAARDRCDETIDLIRSVRNHRYKYIRNFFPHKPHAQPNTYKDGKEIVQHMRQLYAEGQLKEHTIRYFEPVRPTEELYDLENDPWEMNNLAGDTTYQIMLQKMQDMLFTTIIRTNDLGFIPEPILEDLGMQYGNKYYVLQQNNNLDLIRECIETLELVERRNVSGLQKALKHESASVRFWAAYGLGNIPELSANSLPELHKTLNDNSDAVRIAGARALCKLGLTEPALKVLTQNLENKNLIVGFYAAVFIEDLDGELIKKILPSIEKARENPYEFTKRIALRLISEYQ